MKLYRVKLSSVTLLARIADVGGGLTLDGAAFRSGWPEPPPDFSVDRPRPRGRHCAGHEFRRLRGVCPPEQAELRSFLSYPVGGGMGWHTDSRSQGWRAYIPIIPGGRFLYVDDGVIRAREDVDGFANVFHIGDDWTETWHCVAADRPRVVVGIRLAGDPDGWELQPA